MTASSGALYRVGTVDVDGSTALVGTGTSWLSAVIAIAVGDLFTLDMKTWYEVVSVTDDTNIVLDRNFEGGTASGVNYAIVRNTSGTVLTRIAGQIAVQFNQKQLFLDELRTWLNSTNNTESVTDSHGVSTAITTPSQMESEHTARVAQVDSLVGSVQAMTKAEFFALAEQRIRDSAGSGFAEWGLTRNDSNYNLNRVNEGLCSRVNSATWANSLAFGSTGVDSVYHGVSRTANPVVNINGTHLSLATIALSDTYISSKVKFPDAPDGLDKSDGTGRFADLAAAIVAGGNDLTASVLSQQDFVFLESWHEKISDKDVVYPLGNVQFGASTWESITLSNSVVVQGYSAFGEWDTTTQGYGVVWSTLSDTDKTKFIQDPENNIYSDDGELIQVRYRVRVVKSLGDEWEGVNTQDSDNVASGHLRYNASSYILSRGKLNTNLDFTSSSGDNRYLYSGTVNDRIEGVWESRNDTTLAHNGLCFAVPIALVQRRNQGAHHPVLNPNGTTEVRNSANTDAVKWYAYPSAVAFTSTATCFDFANTAGKATPDGGYIASSKGSGRPDGKHFDAIYASDVQDLRMSSKRLPLSEIRKKYKRMAIAGEVRGFEGVPFSSFTTNPASGSTNQVIAPSDVVTIASRPMDLVGWYVVDTNGVILAHSEEVGEVWWKTATSWYLGDRLILSNGSITQNTTDTLIFEINQPHSQANPTWTDIIGDPARIAATLPNGVQGQWVPQIPDGVGTINVNLNRKSIADFDLLHTTDDGATWSLFSVAVDGVDNTFPMTSTNIVGSVKLLHYETQAHFTDDATSVERLTDWSHVYATNHNTEAVLTSSLVGEVSTGIDPSEELSITKVVSDVISHTTESLAPVVKYSTAIDVKDGQAYLMFNVDDAGAIDSSNIKATALPYFIVEE